MDENQKDEGTPIMSVKIDPSRIFTDTAITDPAELADIWTDSLALHLDLDATSEGDKSPERIPPTPQGKVS